MKSRGPSPSRLTLVRIVGSRHGHRIGSFRCSCGSVHEAAVDAVANGAVKSCGCLNDELRAARNHVHGMKPRGAKPRPEYWIWQAVIRRCHTPTSRSWQWYGARGIQVCARWRDSFDAFLEDMGPRPPGKMPSGRAIYSIERKDNNGNYEPGNCVWATARDQALNKRKKGDVHAS